MDVPSQTPGAQARPPGQPTSKGSPSMAGIDRHRAPSNSLALPRPGGSTHLSPRSTVRGSSVRYWLGQGQLVPSEFFWQTNAPKNCSTSEEEIKDGLEHVPVIHARLG